MREARGKPRHGTIKLNAYHEGNQVILEISDDGGGIDLQRVREKAIRNGVIDEADRLSDREIIELIFTPGFSTAEQVTDVSGRGVGMDVVKKNILRLKGVFDVDSRARRRHDVHDEAAADAGDHPSADGPRRGRAVLDPARRGDRVAAHRRRPTCAPCTAARSSRCAARSCR